MQRFISIKNGILLLLTGSILLLIPSKMNAQLFAENELIPEAKLRKGKYYHGTGGAGYWSLDYLDSAGRIVQTEKYKKKQLLSRETNQYDDQNNKIFVTHTFDVNNPQRVDSFRYVYKYANDRIVYQYRKLSKDDTTVTELIENQGDTLLVYQEKLYSYNPVTQSLGLFETTYTLKYNHGLLMNKTILNRENNSSEFIQFTYDEKGRLKSKTSTTNPVSDHQAVYVGGPGGEKEYYKYKLDSKGRVVKFNLIVKDKTYKMRRYSYK
jgi:YD repeat-containing protein